MRTLVIWGLAGLFSIGLPYPPQQVPPTQLPQRDAARDPAKSKEGSGVIRGRIVTADKGTPVRRARVYLMRDGTRIERATTADVEGRYELKGLAPGQYRVKASKPPLLDREYGQRYTAERGTPLDLSEGQTLEKIDISLARGAVIAGRVLDDLGEPAPGVQVNVLRRVYRNGRPEFTTDGQSAYLLTNDAGQYRAFALAPGTYYVGTTRTAFPALDDRDEGLSYPAMFFPGTTNANDAQPVTVGPGEERADVDFGLALLRLATLSGVVVGSSGRNAARGAVLVQPVGFSMTFGVARTSTKPDGRFSIQGLAPGRYVVSAQVAGPDREARETARLVVTLGGENLDGLVLRTSPDTRIAGQIETDDGGVPNVAPLASTRVSATEPSPMGDYPAGGRAAVRPDWSFELENVIPGEVVLRVDAPPNGWALKAVLVGDKDVTDVPLSVKAPEGLTGVRVVLTNRVTEVIGMVTDDRDRPVPAYTVVVFAEDEARWAPSTRFCLAARADHEGRYVVRGLPPGEYRAAALEFVEEGREGDPELLKQLKTRATHFVLDAAEHRALDLKLIREGP